MRAFMLSHITTDRSRPYVGLFKLHTTSDARQPVSGRMMVPTVQRLDTHDMEVYIPNFDEKGEIALNISDRTASILLDVYRDGWVTIEKGIFTGMGWV